MQLSCFGVHEIAGIPVLVQDQFSNPWGVMTGEWALSPKGPCNHAMSVEEVYLGPNERQALQTLAHHPVFQAMLPVPRPPFTGKSFYVEATDVPNWVLAAWAQMSSPTVRPVVRPLWVLSEMEISQELNRSNIQPLVIVETEVQHSVLMAKMVSYSEMTPRTLIISGRGLMPCAGLHILPKAGGQFDREIVHNTNWRAIGNYVLRHTMMGLPWNL